MKWDWLVFALGWLAGHCTGFLLLALLVEAASRRDRRRALPDPGEER